MNSIESSQKNYEYSQYLERVITILGHQRDANEKLLCGPISPQSERLPLRKPLTTSAGGDVEKKKPYSLLS